MSFFEGLGMSIEAATGYRLLRVRPLVPDTNVLLNDVVRFTRTGMPTVMVALGELGAVRLYVSHHVREEVQEHLRTFAEARGVNPDEAEARWEARYLPVVRWVDASAVSILDPRLDTLTLRDPDDVPTAKLALLLGVASLSADNDLVAIDLACGVEWLGIILGARVLTYTELGGALSVQVISVLLDEVLNALSRVEPRRLGKHVLAGVTVAGALAILLHLSGKGEAVAQRFGALRSQVIEVVQDAIVRIFDARNEAEVRIRSIELVEVEPPSNAHRLARVLATTFDPQSIEVLETLLPDLAAAEIECVLQSNGVFACRADGRWELGERDVALPMNPFDTDESVRETGGEQRCVCQQSRFI